MSLGHLRVPCLTITTSLGTSASGCTGRSLSRKRNDRLEHIALAGTLPKAQTHAASVFVDEGNPRELERPLNSRQRSAPRPGTVLFELMDGHYPNPHLLARAE